MNIQRLRELIGDWCDCALTDETAAELSQLLRESSEARCIFRRESHLHGLLHRAVLAEALEQAAGRGATGPGPAPMPMMEPSGDSNRMIPPLPGMRRREVVAWFVAAACFLVVLFTWVIQPMLAPRQVAPPVVSREPPRDALVDNTHPVPAPLTMAQRRQQLLNSAPDAIHIRFNSPEGPLGLQATGDVVWSTAKQTGYLRLKGLASNDPKQSQYQLWIVEENPMRTETVTAGVFDVGQRMDELILPIHSDHFVQRPIMFVISIEPPGGSLDLTGGGLPLTVKVGDLLP